MTRFAIALVTLVAGAVAVPSRICAQAADSAAQTFLVPTLLSVDLRVPVYAAYSPSAEDRANSASTRRLDLSVKRAADEQKHYWPYFTLGGALVGAGAVVGLAVANCNQSCQDDGAVGLPGFIAAGAAIGAAVGTVVGLIVDASRSPGP